MVKHAEKFIAYLENHGVRQLYELIDKPAADLQNDRGLLSLADAYEHHVAAMMRRIEEVAAEEKNPADMIYRYNTLAH